MLDYLAYDTGIWVLISFVLFMYVAYRLGGKAVTSSLDGKIEEIRKEIETAESLRVEAQELLAQYQRKQRDAEKEAQEIVDRAKEHADKIRVEAEKSIEETTTRRETQLKDRIARLEQNAMTEIKSEAARLAMQAASSLIAQDMDKKVHETLLEQTVDTVAQKAN